MKRVRDLLVITSASYHLLCKCFALGSPHIRTTQQTHDDPEMRLRYPQGFSCPRWLQLVYTVTPKPSKLSTYAARCTVTKASSSVDLATALDVQVSKLDSIESMDALDTVFAIMGIDGVKALLDGLAPTLEEAKWTRRTRRAATRQRDS